MVTLNNKVYFLTLGKYIS